MTVTFTHLFPIVPLHRQTEVQPNQIPLYKMEKNINELLSKPIWQMTGEEFLLLNGQKAQEQAPTPTPSDGKRYVYGIDGIARLFGCSKPTANRIKKSGKIDRAIKQIGRKIIVDAELALQLAGEKVGGRRQKQ